MNDELVFKAHLKWCLCWKLHRVTCRSGNVHGGQHGSARIEGQIPRLQMQTVMTISSSNDIDNKIHSPHSMVGAPLRLQQLQRRILGLPKWGVERAASGVKILNSRVYVVRTHDHVIVGTTSPPHRSSRNLQYVLPQTDWLSYFYMFTFFNHSLIQQRPIKFNSAIKSAW